MTTAAVLLGLALAADAFAVSLLQGACARRAPHATALKLGAAFGAAQGVMPLLGWTAGLVLTKAFAEVDHWIAFAILSFLGAKLIKEALEKGDEAAPSVAVGWTLALLALATSIDAAAAGLTFDALRAPPLVTAAIIALVTFIVCVLGVYVGRSFAGVLGKAAELVGGVALIGIGVKVLFDHGVFAAPA